MKNSDLDTRLRAVEVSAPGSIGNLGPGLDVLGLAVEGARDSVRAERTSSPGVLIAESGHPDLPSDPRQHACGIAAAAVLRRAEAEHIGLRLWVRKGLPLSAGQGGSAASAAAGAGAANALLDAPLEPTMLIEAALEAETAIAGRHLDNVAPSILGGLVLIRAMDPLDVVSLPVPGGLHIVLVRPEMPLRTADARRALPLEIPLDTAIHQMAQVGAIVAAAASGDLSLLGRAIDDRVAEPARAPLLPGFVEAKRAGLDAGALGCSISGSGPTVFALTDSEAVARVVGDAMRAAYANAGLKCEIRLTVPDLRGLRVTPA